MSGRRKRHCPDINRKKETEYSETKRRKIVSQERVRKLTDICAKYVAEKFPYEHVENSLQNIPEPIQERIVFWAFPQNEKDIALYSSTNLYNSANAATKQPFQLGIKLVENSSVSDVLQIGKNIKFYFFYSMTAYRLLAIYCHQVKIIFAILQGKFRPYLQYPGARNFVSTEISLLPFSIFFFAFLSELPASQPVHKFFKYSANSN